MGAVAWWITSGGGCRARPEPSGPLGRQPQLGHRLEAGVAEQGAELIGLPQVGRPPDGHAAVGLRSLDVTVTDVQAEQDLTAGDQRSSERHQHHGQHVTGQVEQ